MPEPIYRLRFDQKPGGLFGTSVSSEAATTGSTAAQKNKELQKDKSSTPPLDNAALTDVAPDMHIEKIVNNERIKSSETDFLDTSRPVE